MKRSREHVHTLPGFGDHSEEGIRTFVDAMCEDDGIDDERRAAIFEWPWAAKCRALPFLMYRRPDSLGAFVVELRGRRDRD